MISLYPTPRSLEYFGKKSTVLQPETTAWIANVAANGGTVSISTKIAVDTLIKGLKTDSLFISAGNAGNVIKYLLPYAGDQLVAALCPIIYDYGTSVAVNHNFVAADYTQTTGLASNGSTKYLDTGVSEQSIGGATIGGGFYASADTRNAKAYMGIIDSTGDIRYLLDYSGTFRAFSHAGASGGSNPATAVAALGLTTWTRSSASRIDCFVNGAVGTPNTHAETITDVNLPIFIYAVNSNGSPANYQTCTMGLTYLSKGMNNTTDQTNFYNRVHTFETSMGR